MKTKNHVCFIAALALMFTTAGRELPIFAVIICMIVTLILFILAIPDELIDSAKIYWFEQRKQNGGRKN